MKTKKKKKLKINGLIIIIVIIFVLVDTLFILASIDNTNKKKKKKEPDTKEEIKKEEKPKELEKSIENNNIDNFILDNKERYISYKELHPEYTDDQIVLYVNIGLDKEFYTDIKESPHQNEITILVNKNYSLSENYEPENLQQINSKYTSKKLLMVKEAAEAFEEMAEAAKNEGYRVRGMSSYRDYKYQKDLYARYSKADGQAKADTYSARPGHSEHQTGLAIDVDNANLSYTSFGKTKDFTWMKENSYKYGYILRYTEENKWITGYNNEPWHYRYVGKDIAKYIYENNISYEEYYFTFLNK